MVNYWDYEQYGATGFVYYIVAVIREFWSGQIPQFAFAVIGTVFALVSLVRFTAFVWGFVRPSTLQSYCHSETGSWALVTGASDGIGLGFAEELLSGGFNVLLHGRNKEKLKRAKSELAKTYPLRSVDFVVADASTFDHPENIVVDKVKQLPGKLVLLINNVGGITTYPQFRDLANTPGADVDTSINVNARFPSQLTRALLPTLRENKPALILNCSSVTGMFGAAYAVSYSATKAFISGFTRALRAEFVADGLLGKQNGTPDLDVICCVIGNVRSASNPSAPSFFTIDSRHCARGCLARVGTGNAVEYANWRQAVLLTVVAMLPESRVVKAMVTEMKALKEREEKQNKEE